MTEYIYRFGYESPEECASNASNGTDFESSDFLRILAANEAEALRWGQELSEWFVKKLFRDPTKSWKKEGFASWVELQPDAELREAAQRSPLITVGGYPDFGAMKPPAALARRSSTRSSAAMQTHDGFLHLLEERFPKLRAELEVEVIRGLLHPQMGQFAQFTQAAIDAGDFESVTASFRLVDQLMANPHPALLNALNVSYLEMLSFDCALPCRFRALVEAGRDCLARRRAPQWCRSRDAVGSGDGEEWLDGSGAEVSRQGWRPRRALRALEGDDEDGR